MELSEEKGKNYVLGSILISTLKMTLFVKVLYMLFEKYTDHKYETQ